MKLPLCSRCLLALICAFAGSTAFPISRDTAVADAALSAPASVPFTHESRVTTPRRSSKVHPHKPPAHDPKATRVLDLPNWGAVTIYAPRGRARGLALFASGDGGWELGVWDMAHQAAELGYWVAGFSTPRFLKTLDNNDAKCSNAAMALARLGNQVRAALKISIRYQPLLIGYSSGATVAYAAMAQDDQSRFSGAMTLGFCPDLIYRKPFCDDTGLTAQRQHKPLSGFVFDPVATLHAPWIVLQGDIDKVCNATATVHFVDKVKNGHVVRLAHVGHGYGVPRNWMPQYIQGLIELRDAATPIDSARVH